MSNEKKTLSVSDPDQELDCPTTGCYGTFCIWDILMKSIDNDRELSGEKVVECQVCKKKRTIEFHSSFEAYITQ